MGYVAITAAFACLLGMRFAARNSPGWPSGCAARSAC
jgi:hypothetical protein